MTVIKYVEPHSHGERAGIAAGDVLVAINGHNINDVLDYRFYLTERMLTVSVIRDGKPLEFTVRKGEYDDLGLDFDTPLMDQKHSCKNKCIFCFIDQLPRGMRKSLYFKDDDSRLSFLHGNYITLTNLSDEDIDRIIKMRISPLRVSVHTTDPELRVQMMKNPRAGQVLSYIDRIAEAGIDIDAQVVLCRGVNDGEALARTMRDLLKYYPALQSVSIVPAGLTRHRDGLYPLSPYTPAESADIIAQVTEMGDACVENYGRRIFFCADELYIRANLPLPDADYYEGFAQIEDGVGLIASLCEEFGWAMEDLELPARLDRRVTMVTGTAAYDTLSRLASRLCLAVEGLEIDVIPIKNDFFGHSVTVAGLLTATDIAAQLTGVELGDELLFPAVALRASDEAVFLDDKTPEWLSEQLGVPVRAVPNDGEELVRMILRGADPDPARGAS